MDHGKLFLSRFFAFNEISRLSSLGADKSRKGNDFDASSYSPRNDIQSFGRVMNYSQSLGLQCRTSSSIELSASLKDRNQVSLREKDTQLWRQASREGKAIYRSELHGQSAGRSSAVGFVTSRRRHSGNVASRPSLTSFHILNSFFVCLVI